jgi:hypothetical protein
MISFGVSSRLVDYSILKISDDFACTVQPCLAYYTQPVAKDIQALRLYTSTICTPNLDFYLYFPVCC